MTCSMPEKWVTELHRRRCVQSTYSTAFGDRKHGKKYSKSGTKAAMGCNGT